MRTDWSRTIDWDSGYMVRPDVRPEEQHRLVPRFEHCPCDYGAEARCQKHGGTACKEQAEPPASCIDTRASVLDEAKAVIKERGENYDHPLINHQRIAALWSVVLGTQVTPLQVVQCMIAVKLARLIATPDHRDSLTDLCGYAHCAEIIARDS